MARQARGQRVLTEVSDKDLSSSCAVFCDELLDSGCYETRVSWPNIGVGRLLERNSDHSAQSQEPPIFVILPQKRLSAFRDN
jgi:hypothetical protein